MSDYLLKPKRSESEARAARNPYPATREEWRAEHARLNEEARAHFAYRNSPEGMAERKRWAAFLSLGQDLIRSGEGGALIYWESGE